MSTVTTFLNNPQDYDKLGNFSMENILKKTNETSFIIYGGVGCGKTENAKKLITKDISDFTKKIILIKTNDEYEELEGSLKANKIENINNNVLIDDLLTTLNINVNDASAKSILEELLIISDVAINSNVEKIYIEDIVSNVFLRNINLFAQYKEKIRYIVLTCDVNRCEYNLKDLNHFFSYIMVSCWYEGVLYKTKYQ